MEQVIFGQVLTAGCGQNPARQAVLDAGLSWYIPAITVNQLCGSGLRAVCLAFSELSQGDANDPDDATSPAHSFIIAGGQESMSLAPLIMPPSLRTAGFRFGHIQAVDTLLLDGLTDATHNIHMGQTAENIAQRFAISRQEQDEFALQSQSKYAQALKNGDFLEEIVPVEVSPSRNKVVTVTHDEHPRPDITLDRLSKLTPAFLPAEVGTVTAGNASGINDGAAAVLLTRFSALNGAEQTPLARVVSWAQVGCDPLYMGLGPVPAVLKALERAHWSRESVDIWELNEAFAVQTLAVVKELQINPEKVNVGGGAIALGHPIGASGCRILVTLLYHLQRLQLSRGVAALCIGGGMGIAICVER